MKQTKQFLRPLLMAIVMMALSPAKAWAEKTFKILVSDDSKSATLFYDEDAHEGSNRFSMSEFKNLSNSINNITLDPSMADYRPTDCSGWFYGFSDVTTINGLEYLNTSEVTSMYGMFRNCRKLTSLDLSNFDTSKVTNMSYMFGSCEILSTLTFPASFNTSKVTDMSYMFNNCQALTSLDVSCFDTQEVMNMKSMFSGCQNLTSLSVSSFNTCNVENMTNMFQNCKNLSSLSLASFNTEKVTTMEMMFYNCSGLTSLDLSSFVPKNVTTMKQMFEGCTKLASIDLSNFNTAKVTNMSRMFSDCQALTSLDLSSFNTAKVTQLGMMFCDCYKLKYFKFGNFDMSSVANSDNYNVVANCNAEDKEIIFTSIPYIKDGYMSIKPLTNVASITYQLDDNSTIFTGATYPPAASTTSATYSHEMSNEYETLVLPFAVTYTADNGNYKLYNLSGTTGSDLYFTEYANGAEIAAGTPMAVKAVGSKNGAGKYEISFAGSGAVNTTITPVTKGSITFTGTYSDVKLNAGAGCNFDGEKFVCTTEQVTESPFRCYITASGDELPAELRLVEHTHTEVTDEEVPATCTTPGHTAGKHCSVCGEVLEGLEEIPALGHTFTSKTLTAEPDEHGLYAYVCDREGCEGHSDYNVVKASDGVGATTIELTATTVGETTTYTAEAPVTLTDAGGFASPVPFTAASITYTRTLAADKWGTLCLPYALSAKDGYEYYTLSAATSEEVTLSKIDEVPAGTPVLVRHSDDGNLSLTESKVLVGINSADGSSAGNLKLMGTFVPKEVNTGYYLDASDSQLHSIELYCSEKSKPSLTIPAFRAWFASSSPTGAPLRINIDDDEATAIAAISALTEGKAEIYDMNGRRIQSLQKGVNIMKYGNGKTKKVIIK